MQEKTLFPIQNAFTLPVTMAEVLAVGYGSGNTMYRNWRIKHGWKSMCFISRQEHQLTEMV